jgi:hypothetical protein
VRNVLPSWDAFGKPNFFMTRLNKDSLLATALQFFDAPTLLSL